MSKGRETKRKERREKAQRIAIENNKQKKETLNDLLRIKDVRYTAINLRIMKTDDVIKLSKLGFLLMFTSLVILLVCMLLELVLVIR